PATAPPPAPGMLCDVRVLDPRPARRLVTPRWSLDGDRLLLSGWGGVGLFVADLGAGSAAVITELTGDPAGGVEWAPDGVSILHPRAGGAGEFTIAEAGGAVLVYKEYRGRISLVAEGAESIAVDADAWGVRSSPDRSRVAYCTGTLADPTLHVLAADGRDIVVGRGAHASWFPDSERLVYSVPWADVGPDGPSGIAAADLYVVAASGGAPVPLTRTPDAIEMEPAVSPRGDRIAFADWRSGTVRIGRLARAGERCGGEP
ncbi:MAG: hypothetical protein QME96_16165, partial [Myxococcota bacterium]|nr:hypothetical protein [Myxococcota bacterium]